MTTTSLFLLGFGWPRELVGRADQDMDGADGSEKPAGEESGRIGSDQPAGDENQSITISLDHYNRMMEVIGRIEHLMTTIEMHGRLISLIRRQLDERRCGTGFAPRRCMACGVTGHNRSTCGRASR